MIFELLVQFYLSGQIFVKNGPFKLYLLRRSRFRLVELDKCFVVLDLTRVWSIVFIWESFYCPHFGVIFCAHLGIISCAHLGVVSLSLDFVVWESIFVLGRILHPYYGLWKANIISILTLRIFFEILRSTYTLHPTPDPNLGFSFFKFSFFVRGRCHF